MGAVRESNVVKTRGQVEAEGCLKWGDRCLYFPVQLPTGRSTGGSFGCPLNMGRPASSTEGLQSAFFVLPEAQHAHGKEKDNE